MQRAIVFLVLVAVLGIAPTVAASETQVTAHLVPVHGSVVSGAVVLDQLHEGTRIVVRATGLTPGAVYTSFYYDNSECTKGPDVVGTFKADHAGIGRVTGTADDDLDEIGSVSVRLGHGYGTLLACAKVH